MSDFSFGKVVHLRGRSYLVKLKSGAVLVWRFEEDEESDATLHVHLTDAESQKVFETERTDGMIEAVRPTLRDPWALLVVTDTNGSHFRRYNIPAWGNEHEFAEELRIAAASTPEYQANVLFSMEAEMKSLKQQIATIAAARDELVAEHEAERDRLRRRLKHAEVVNREESDFLKSAESLAHMGAAAV